jgi:hypothetical protein
MIFMEKSYNPYGLGTFITNSREQGIGYALRQDWAETKERTAERLLDIEDGLLKSVCFAISVPFLAVMIPRTIYRIHKQNKEFDRPSNPSLLESDSI